MYNIDVFSWQYPVLNDFVYHYVAYKKIRKDYHLLQGEQDFWIRTADSHLKTSVIAWCMVFGVDSNSIHWKNTIIKDEKKHLLINEFRRIIFESNDFNQDSYQIYWESITSFRNDFIAHRSINNIKPVPYLDIALNVALKYDEWIRKIIEPDMLDSPTLEESFIIYSSKIEETLHLVEIKEVK